MQRTVTGTAVDVITTKRSGGGLITVTIDGNAKASIDTNNATEANGFSTRYGGLAQGSHVLGRSCTTASAYAVVEGIVEFNQDETAGIRIWEGADAGYNSTSYVNITKWAATADAVMVPDFAFLALGLNDYASGGTITPPQYKTNMHVIFAGIQTANPECPVILHNSYERGDQTSPPYPWSDYLAKINEIVAADSKTLVVDLNERLKGWNLVPSADQDVWDGD